MSLKFIKLFEDFSEDKLETWSQVRDCLQMKKPFIIIVFRTKESYLNAVDSEFSETDYIKQTAYMSKDGKTIQYPSIFFKLGEQKDFSNSVKRYNEEFDIILTILGKSNSEFSTVYFEDGNSSDFGNEIVSSTSPKEVEDSNYFKVGGTYYKFIEFYG